MSESVGVAFYGGRDKLQFVFSFPSPMKKV